MGKRRILLETDCLELVQLWRRAEDQRSTVDPVLQEIEDLSRTVDDFSLAYVISRSCNKMAHVLSNRSLVHVAWRGDM